MPYRFLESESYDTLPLHLVTAMSPMYMMPHRPMFTAGQPGIASAHPGYMPMAAAAASTATPQQMMSQNLPELTVKTTQATAHASTSPNKPMSAASSPKVNSLLDRLHSGISIIFSLTLVVMIDRL